MIVVVDNYDSFVYNLARYLGELGAPRVVVRHDEVTVDYIAGLNPAGVVLGPGPRAPDQAGVCLGVVERLSGVVPILGVCLGHQAVVQAFGGRVRRAGRPRHGMASDVHHDGRGLFRGLPRPMPVGRYHSLVADPAPGGPLRVVARSLDDDEVMAVAHATHPTWGVQFHPESVLTPDGRALLANFLGLVARCGR